LKLRVLTQILCMTLLLLCCSRTPTRTVDVRSESPGSFEAWRVDLHVSGGFAGVDRALTISSNGDLSAEDRRQSARVTAKATAAELDQIAPLVVRIKSISDTPRVDGKCRDCLSYNLTIEVDGERFSALLDDTTLPGSGLSELASALSALLNRTFSTK
jgi:hypothetical protein